MVTSVEAAKETPTGKALVYIADEELRATIVPRVPKLWL